MTGIKALKVAALTAVVAVPLAYWSSGSTIAQEAYVDPAGRFTMPIPSNWEQTASEERLATFFVPDANMNMHVLTVEADDVVSAQMHALNVLSFDPAELHETKAVNFAGWDIFFYTHSDGSGVTPMCRVDADVSYCLVVTGDAALTQEPPGSVMTAIQSFAPANASDGLPKTVAEFEADIANLVGEAPPGMSVVIATGSDVIYANGFGLADGPAQVPAVADTVFMWASMTKMVTATAVMQLVDQGMIELDTPVSEYLDYFPNELGITVRQLLSHSSGMGDPQELILKNASLQGQPVRDADRITREFFHQAPELNFEPGATSAYSTPGTLTLGQIVAEISGETYANYVREQILSPLDMNNTDFFYSNDHMISNAAAPAVAASQRDVIVAQLNAANNENDGEAFFREEDGALAWMSQYRVFGAGSGLIGPATEAMRFVLAHANGGEIDGVRILSTESASAMQDMQLGNSGAALGWGLGWHINDTAEHAFVEHDGGGPGMSTKMRIYPDSGVSILMMSNAQGWNMAEVADAAANVVFTMMAPAGPEVAAGPEIITDIPPIVDADGDVVPDGLASLERVTLGGIEQSILIRTQDVSNPVLLILHGGPGATLMAFVEQIQPPKLEENFTVVHWDQRGAGKSYDPALTIEDLSAQNLVSDTMELTALLRERFGQEKIFLTGHSWGSGLGFLVLQQDSSPYHAYIASAERISWEGSHQAGFDWVKQQATEQQVAPVLEQIAKIEPFDVEDPEDVAALYQGLIYFRGGDVYTPGLWDEMMAYAFGGKSPYYTQGEMDTYIDAMNITQAAIEPFIADSYDLTQSFTQSDIPIHFLQGEHDQYAPEALSRPYLEALDAPAKSYTVIPGAGHSMMYDNPSDWADALINIKNQTLGQ